MLHALSPHNFIRCAALAAMQLVFEAVLLYKRPPILDAAAILYASVYVAFNALPFPSGNFLSALSRIYIVL